MLQMIVAALIVGVDQLVKYLISANIGIGETRAFLGDFLVLTHYRNTGAAFSILREHTWLLTVASSIAVVVIIFVLLKKYVKHPLGVWSLTAVLGGALGNLLDRIIHGYVVDMFKTELFEFAVFNVADIFITCGGIAFCIYILTQFSREQRESADGAAQADEAGRCVDSSDSSDEGAAESSPGDDDA